MRGEVELSALRDKAVENLNLPRNTNKGHWSEMSKPRLLWLLTVEVFELAVAVWVLYRARRRYLYTLRHHRDVSDEYLDECDKAYEGAMAAVAHEAADVNCFAMMIASNSNAL